jgi:NADH-quinone oxidoreductase subunit M
VGEFLVLLGAFKTSFAWAAVAATGVILSACYMLWMFQRVVFGPVTHEENQRLGDVTLREKLMFAPLLVLIFWMGVAPQPFLDRAQPVLDRTLELTRQRAVSSASAAGVELPGGTLSTALRIGPAFWVRASPADTLGSFR